jgi:hypothetical protein
VDVRLVLGETYMIKNSLFFGIKNRWNTLYDVTHNTTVEDFIEQFCKMVMFGCVVNTVTNLILNTYPKSRNVDL